MLLILWATLPLAQFPQHCWGFAFRVNHRNIFRIIEHLQNHYEDITQDGLSRQFGYSTRQMTRLIKEYTGKTFTEIVQLQINGYYSRS